ncbi:hypothetical protein HDU96_000315 [Phlyctochytrium bullatum]|nr:hypothetical protein HDU96_000315 [Phlyctochytrium bullatum]
MTHTHHTPAVQGQDRHHQRNSPNDLRAPVKKQGHGAHNWGTPLDDINDPVTATLTVHDPSQTAADSHVKVVEGREEFERLKAAAR